MQLPGQLESTTARRTLAAVASIALHAMMFVVVVILGGGQHEGIGSGDTLLSQLVMIEAPEVDRTEGIDIAALESAVAEAIGEAQLPAEPEPSLASIETVTTEPPAEQAAMLEVPLETTADIAKAVVQAAVTFPLSEQEKTSLPQRLARAAEGLENATRTLLEWQENGKQYTAQLIRERAKDGTALEHVIAEVSASDNGKLVSTRIMLKRLAFSQFTQMVDQWDPMVQLHDDLIVGRFHSNSRFNVMHDSRVGPTFLGKVTTAARSFEMFASGRRRQSDMFRGGVETRAGRIDLPEASQPSAWAPQDAEARVHELADDTHIRFFADGSYMWRSQGSSANQYLNAPSDHPVYFIAALGTTLYVQGTVAGNILVYSPHKIVIEDSLIYAHDPRATPDSHDYLGLVSAKYIEIAAPEVTGPGDLDVHAAIFAGRRFVVRDIDYSRSATLRILGSLSAGSLSASEPRYATEIEYDARFERRRPPGFPMTKRYEAENWDAHWTETQQQQTADGAL